MSGAIAGLAIGVVSTGLSFAQAGKQRKLQQKAEREADAAMQAARGKLEVNFAEQQAIKKEAYELEREANLSAGAQAMAAGVEGGARGGAATAGRVLGQQNLAQSNTRVAMADEAAAMAPLYRQNMNQQKAALSGVTGLDGVAGSLAFSGAAGTGKNAVQSFDSTAFNTMNNSELRKYKRNLTPLQRQQLFQNEGYLKGM